MTYVRRDLCSSKTTKPQFLFMDDDRPESDENEEASSEEEESTEEEEASDEDSEVEGDDLDHSQPRTSKFSRL